MPKMSVNGATLAYEVLGEGPPVVLTPTAWNGMEYMRPVAEALAPQYQVLVYDRRNCGVSDIVIEDAPSEWHIWVRDLHVLLESLDMSPAYVGGTSGGCVLSLLMGHMYPEDVRGLLLLLVPTDDRELLADVASRRYGELPELAENKGMRTVADSPFLEQASWAAWTEQGSSSHDRFLSMRPHDFAAVMRRWQAALATGRFHFANLADEELQGITSPALIIPGLDELHPQAVCKKLHSLLPHSELILPDDLFSAAEMEQFHQWRQQDGSHIRYNPALAPLLDRFMQQCEGHQFP